MMDQVQRMNKAVPSLSLLSQIEVIRMIHRQASKMESEYMDKWRENELTTSNRELEANLDIKAPEIDTSAIVLKFKSQEADLLRNKRQAAGKQAKTDLVQKKTTNRMGTRYVPYPKRSSKYSQTEEALKKAFQIKIRNGIPEGVKEKDYIEYRKCKYIEDIKLLRKYLIRNLTPGILNDLLGTMSNIAKYNNKHEHGLLTLQAILFTPHSLRFEIASSQFHRVFGIKNQFLNKQHMQLAEVENRIGTTILYYTLLNGTHITHLHLGECCSDGILKVISDVALNLKYLNISGSVVTDKGLTYLCGVDKECKEIRAPLSRRCKRSKAQDIDKYVTNTFPRWEKKRPGCEKLVHFEGYNLSRLEWPGQTAMKYIDHQNIPLDCGFVAILTFMPELKTFLTEVGGRAIQVWSKIAAKKRSKKKHLNIIQLSEAHMTPAIMKLVKIACPNLQSLKIDWYEFFKGQTNSREEWFPYLSDIPKLKELRTGDIDLKTNVFQEVLSKIGPNLTVIKMTEVWKFKYSNFRAVKIHCANLEVFVMTMTSKTVVANLTAINVDMDYNLQLNGWNDDSYALKKLKGFHLCGPFYHEVVKYFLKGADNLKSLSLSIEWLDPTFSENQPQSRKDLIGTEYLNEILSVNKLSHLEEIHLLAQYRRGRSRLKISCAELILEKIPTVRHIGNFQFWDLRQTDVDTIKTMIRSSNLNVTIDEDLYVFNASKGSFEYKYVEGREKLCCKEIPLRSSNTTSILSDFLDVLAGPPDLMDDDDDDASLSDFEDDVSLGSSDDLSDNENNLGGIDMLIDEDDDWDFQQPCPIM